MISHEYFFKYIHLSVIDQFTMEKSIGEQKYVLKSVIYTTKMA